MLALKAGMKRIFPQLQGISIDYNWSEHIAEGRPMIYPVTKIRALYGTLFASR